MARRHDRAGLTRSGVKAILIVATALVLMSCIVGTTIAWLIAKTAPVTNVFTYGDIDITLDESDPDGDGDPNNNTYPMIPGNEISKDPKVTVKAGSEDCWLFVKVEESANLKDFITYAMAAGWTALSDNPGVYWREVYKNETTDQAYDVIAGNKVTVKAEVTKEMLEALDATAMTNYPTLTITAYAVQLDKSIEAINTVAEAWTQVLAAQANP